MRSVCASCHGKTSCVLNLLERTSAYLLLNNIITYYCLVNPSARKMGNGDIFYFAYGSNMCREKLEKRAIIDDSRISLVNAWKCRLRGWRLCFDILGGPPVDPCFASIEPAKEEFVYGVTYQLKSAEDWQNLEASEGVGKRLSWYTVAEVDVECLDTSGNVVNTLHVKTFVSNPPLRIPKWYQNHIHPSRRYMSLLIKGAEVEDLPMEYVKKLRNMQTARVWPLSSLVIFQSCAFCTLISLISNPFALFITWPYRNLCWRFYGCHESIVSKPYSGFLNRIVALFCLVGLYTVYGLYAIPGFAVLAVSPKRRSTYRNISALAKGNVAAK